MKALRDVLSLAVEFLEKHAVLRPRLFAETLLAHYLSLKRIELYMHFDRPLLEEELAPFRMALKRAIKGEPLEYILGEVEFYGVQLKITSDVLIPRQETEILLDSVCKQMGSEKTVLDLCTGSGCLAIGLKKAYPNLEVVGTDLSEKALEIARENAQKNRVEIEWLLGDLTTPIKGRKFDLVLCNPPYVRSEDYQNLDRGVRGFEPMMALDAGPSGYEFFERLSQELPPVLNEGAKVFFEIGADQGKGILERFSKGPWGSRSVMTDWAGLDRFFFLKMKGFSSILEGSNYV